MSGTEKKPAVPKFSSFKPPSAALTAGKTDTIREQIKPATESDKQKSLHQDRDRERDRVQNRDREREGDRNRQYDFDRDRDRSRSPGQFRGQGRNQKRTRRRNNRDRVGGLDRDRDGDGGRDPDRDRDWDGDRDRDRPGRPYRAGDGDGDNNTRDNGHRSRSRLSKRRKSTDEGGRDLGIGCARDRDGDRDRSGRTYRDGDGDNDSHDIKHSCSYSSSLRKKSNLPAVPDERGRGRGRDRDGDGDRDRPGQPCRDADADGDSSHDKRHPSRSHSSPHRKPTVSTIPNEPRVFVIDTRGDPFIARYGRQDRSDIPAYRRAGNGRVLGTEGRLVVRYEGTQEVISLKLPGGGAGTDDPSRRFRVAANPRRVRGDPGGRDSADADSGANEDFIIFDSHESNKRERDDGRGPAESSDDDEEELSYRSIHGKAKPRAFSDAESDDSPVPERDPSGALFLKQRSIELSRLVEEHPEDTPAWLALVAHQDALLRAGEDPERDVPSADAARAASRSFSEIKLSMLESALRHVPDSPGAASDREAVLLGIMREGAEVWAPDAVGRKMRKIADENRSSFRIWRAHVDFGMRNLVEFSVGRITDLFRDRLQFLEGVIRNADAAEKEETYCQCIYVLLRATRFLCEAGFAELSVAAWQAVLEVNLMRPAGVGEDKSAVLGEYGGIWENEGPRIGEEGAKGWRYHQEHGGLPESPKPNLAPPVAEKKAAGSGLYREWYEAERQAAVAARMPARVMDEGILDDPFRLVMFGDVCDLLFVIPSDLLTRGLAETLVDSFLIFCGAPPAWGTRPWVREAYGDAFLTGSTSGLEGLVVNTAATVSLPDQQGQTSPRKPLPFAQAGLRMAPSPSVLFPGPDWFRYIPGTLGTERCSDSPEPGWVLGTIQQLTQMAGIEDLAGYCLGWEWTVNPRGVRRAAQRLLEQFPNNLQLYACYALAEYGNDNRDMAETVFGAAARLAGDSSDEASLVLWETWAWTYLESGRFAQAINRLCASVNLDPALRASSLVVASPIQVLLAKQTFLLRRTKGLAEGNYVLAATYAQCLCTLEYLTAIGRMEPVSASQGNISAAMESVLSFSAELQQQHGTDVRESAGHEQVLQFACRLMYLHASRGPFKRAFLVDHLAKFSAFFPRNGIFLSLLSWCDSGLPTVHDPVDTVFRDIALSPSHDCVTSRLQFIAHELVTRGSVYRAQAAFESALQSRACVSSPALWRCYVLFCAALDERDRKMHARGGGAQKQTERKERQGGERPSHSRAAFYRAVGSCPWSRALLADVACDILATARLDDEEVRAVYDGWTRRKVRVHVDMNEFVKKRLDTLD